MTDSAKIQVGDLVMVVRGRRCCGYAKFGMVHHVTQIRMSSKAGIKCTNCGTIHSTKQRVPVSERPHGVTELYRLKRIPPLSELESSKTDEPMKEPA